MKRMLRSPLHGIVSSKFVLLTFTGRKSGRVYSTPVQYVQDGDTLHIITSAGYTWWKNLHGGAPVQVHLRGSQHNGHADTSSDPQTINRRLAQIYPGLSAEIRERFVSGKVAIAITLQTGEDSAS
jgi:deazaflavin-dependent oxidoreductase (nitroreductase family)